MVGFDIERHAYALPEQTPEADGCKHTKPVENRGWSQGCAISLGMEGETQRPRTRLARYPAQLVLQDVLTVRGSQFRDAALIVASPPCQAYSWLAMPWSRSSDPENSKAAKALRKKWETEGPDNRLFDACFRIQREAIEATRKPCPACDGSGQITWYVGDVRQCQRCGGEGTVTRYIPMVVENVRGAQPWVGPAKANYGSFYLWGDVHMVGDRIFAGRDGFGGGLRVPKRGNEKVPSFRFDGSGGSFRTAAVKQSMGRGDWFSKEARAEAASARFSSRSNARKAASAMIAKIPLPLSRYIAKQFIPQQP